MQIIIHPNSSPEFSLEVQPTDNLQSVKEKILAKLGTPLDKQRLLFQGTQLEVGRTIQDYRITAGNTIVLIIG